MTALKIVYHPDPRLKIKTQPVLQVNEEIKKIAHDMIETMYLHDGIGLAATQVGIKHQLFVLDISPEHDQPHVFINPNILELGPQSLMREACISFPGIYAEVLRSETLTIEYLDSEGQQHTLHADGLLAHCIQHEYDHTLGITMLDYLSPLKRQRATKKVLDYIKNNKDIA